MDIFGSEDERGSYAIARLEQTYEAHQSFMHQAKLHAPLGIWPELYSVNIETLNEMQPPPGRVLDALVETYGSQYRPEGPEVPKAGLRITQELRLLMSQHGALSQMRDGLMASNAAASPERASDSHSVDPPFGDDRSGGAMTWDASAKSLVEQVCSTRIVCSN